MKRVKLRGKEGVAPVGYTIGGKTIGMGYIFLPYGVDRKLFIETCFRTNTVTMMAENGQMINRCPITSEALQNISFPEENLKLGTMVLWATRSNLSKPIIFATFPATDGFTERNEEEFIFEKAIGNSIVKICGSATDNKISITVNSEEASNIDISVQGNEDSHIAIFSTGETEVKANKKLKVESYSELEARVYDAETKNESGIRATKDETIMFAIYGEEEEKDGLTTTVNAEGLKTEIKLGEASYIHTVVADKAETTFQDCVFRFEDGKVTLSQGEKAILELSNGKVAFINAGTGLYDLLTKIVDAIATLTVSTAVGPSGTPLPPTIQKTTELTQLLGQFFNR